MCVFVCFCVSGYVIVFADTYGEPEPPGAKLQHFLPAAGRALSGREE